jgi:hypothetical protein
MPPTATLQALQELCCQADGLEAHASAKLAMSGSRHLSTQALAWLPLNNASLNAVKALLGELAATGTV